MFVLDVVVELLEVVLLVVVVFVIDVVVELM
jgi:hypothetical protein